MTYLNLDFYKSVSSRLFLKKYTCHINTYHTWICYRERELRLKVVHRLDVDLSI